MKSMDLLLTWAPFLLQGFVWNVVIALVAVGLGTLLGGACAVASFSQRPAVLAVANGVPAFFRAVPTLVLIFYLVSLLPNALNLGLLTVPVPAWLKAAVALSAAPLGFVAWNLRAALKSWREGNHAAAMMFIPNWTGTFLISLLASSTASLVGVSELVGRCNTVVTAIGPEVMLPVYFYGSLIFFLFCGLLNIGLGQLRVALGRRFEVFEAAD